MERDLRKYIDEQKKAGVNPSALRYNLLKSGWPKERIDDEIARVYAGSSGPTVLSMKLVLFLVIVIAALAVVLIYFASRTTDNNHNIIPTPQEENPCVSITKSDAKDVCYQQLVADGFDCGSLVDEYENAFCYRALDSYLTSR